MTATRWPVKSTRSCGHRPVWKVGPAKDSRPFKAGTLADDRQPVAMMQKRALHAATVVGGDPPAAGGLVERAPTRRACSAGCRGGDRSGRRRGRGSAGSRAARRSARSTPTPAGARPRIGRSTPCSRRRSARPGSGSRTTCRRRRSRPRRRARASPSPRRRCSMQRPAKPAPTITASKSELALGSVIMHSFHYADAVSPRVARAPVVSPRVHVGYMLRIARPSACGP